jgi:hypothetical protein
MGGMAHISRRVFLAATPLLPLAPYLTRILFAQQGSNGGARFYVGTYTHDMGPGGKADGIYTAEWDASSGALTPCGEDVESILHGGAAQWRRRVCRQRRRR